MTTRTARGESYLASLGGGPSPAREALSQRVREQYESVEQVLNDIGAVARLVTESGREILVAIAVRRQFLPFDDNRATRGIKNHGTDLVGFDIGR